MSAAARILPLVPRPATASDAPAILALKRRAFGERYLRYTIYQTAESVCYLAELASSPDHDLFVTENRGQLTGYYLASVQRDSCLLNYIATAAGNRSSGLGSILLNHFHHRVLARKQTAARLNVFTGNQTAFFWYRRAGYRITSESRIYRLRLDDIPLGDPTGLSFRPTELADALRGELTLGFSKLEGSFRNTPITLGLIGGHTCKLLAFDMSLTSPLIRALKSSVYGRRSNLVLTRPVSPSEPWPVLQSDVSFSMVKHLY